MADPDVVTSLRCGQNAQHHKRPMATTSLVSGRTKRGRRMTSVAHEIDGKVGVVTLAKPPHNLIDDRLIEDLVAAYGAVVDGGCRAILLRSSMRHFCAGA